MAPIEWASIIETAISGEKKGIDHHGTSRFNVSIKTKKVIQSQKFHPSKFRPSNFELEAADPDRFFCVYFELFPNYTYVEFDDRRKFRKLVYIRPEWYYVEDNYSYIRIG